MVTNEANKERKPGSHEYLHVFREKVGLDYMTTQSHSLSLASKAFCEDSL